MQHICTKVCAKGLKKAQSIRKRWLPLEQTGWELVDQ